jgi:hypothetical protein
LISFVTRRNFIGPFNCIELWLENRLLIEILTPEMQAQYRANMKMSNWSDMFGGLSSVDLD